VSVETKEAIEHYDPLFFSIVGSTIHARRKQALLAASPARYVAAHQRSPF
jgi:hypothetical protein